MNKIVTWTTVGLFALSLQGPALAQQGEKAPETMPPAMESPAPLSPVEQVVTPGQPETKAKKQTSLKSKKKKTNQKRAKKKKGKKAKKTV